MVSSILTEQIKFRDFEAERSIVVSQVWRLMTLPCLVFSALLGLNGPIRVEDETRYLWRFPFDQIVRFEISGIPYDEWNNFPFRWTNPSQVIRFQVSRENTKSNRGLFHLCLLALGLLDDAEVESNDVLLSLSRALWRILRAKMEILAG